MKAFADRLDVVAARHLEAQLAVIDGDKLDIGGHVHADRRRRRMAEIDVDADRALLRRQVWPQASMQVHSTKPTRNAVAKTGGMSAKPVKALGDGGHGQALVDKNGLPVAQAWLQLIE